MHVPIPHLAVVDGLVETLSRRHIDVVGEEYAVSKDGMETFGVIDLESSFDGCRFAIGIRNANNKRFRLSCTVGLRVFVCHNLAFQGDYGPVLAKHSKNFSLADSPLLALIECSVISSQCGSRWRRGGDSSCCQMRLG